MSRVFSKFFLAAFTISFLGFSILHAQTDSIFQSPHSYNTKKNYVFVNGSIGGGDYPFAGFGLNLSHQFFNGNTMAGIGVHYIGNTSDGTWTGIDPVQIIPLMVDIRQTFMESRDGRFATLLIADAGYVISLTGNETDSEGNSFEYLNGWAINPGIGFRYNIFENMGVMLDITWLHHESQRVWLAPVDQMDHKHWDLALIRGSIFF